MKLIFKRWSREWWKEVFTIGVENTYVPYMIITLVFVLIIVWRLSSPTASIGLGLMYLAHSWRIFAPMKEKVSE